MESIIQNYHYRKIPAIQRIDNRVVTVGWNQLNFIQADNLIHSNQSNFWDGTRVEFGPKSKNRTHPKRKTLKCTKTYINHLVYDLCLIMRDEEYVFTDPIQVSRPYRCHQTTPCHLVPQWQIEKSWYIESAINLKPDVMATLFSPSVTGYSPHDHYAISSMNLTIPIPPSQTGYLLFSPLFWKVTGNTTMKLVEGSGKLRSFMKPITIYIPLITPRGYLDGVYGSIHNHEEFP